MRHKRRDTDALSSDCMQIRSRFLLSEQLWIVREDGLTQFVGGWSQRDDEPTEDCAQTSNQVQNSPSFNLRFSFLQKQQHVFS